MTLSAKDQHDLTLGETTYWLRTPTPYDLPKMRRILTRQGVRRPAQNELRVAALAGIAAMAVATGLAEEGEAQSAIVEEWYRLLPSIDENEIDEPDGEKRAVELARQETDRQGRIAELYADVMAIEANLERHHPPYRELIADGRYWDEVSRIDAVRLLLVRTQAGALPRDADDMLDPAVYMSIPDAHRVELATKAFTLLTPSEAQRKN